MLRRSSTLILSAGWSLALCGCSSSSAPSAPPAPTVCTAPGYHVDADAVTIDQVDATLHDPAGAAAANLPVQVCGINQCFNGTTNAAGKTSVTPRSSLERPAFKYGDGFEFAELAAPLGNDASQDLGQLVALPLPAFADGAAFPPSGAVTNGDVTLSIASGASVVHDVLTYDDSQLVFRSVSIPLAQSARAADPSLGFELAYALAPLGTTFCPPARLHLPNTPAWPPGSALEVFVQGLDVAEKWASYGTWTQVAEAIVSPDGNSIDTTSGGIPILSSIAVRQK